MDSLQKKLLRWYRKKARVLPWRQTKDPYRIWISEAMLQQTQVATVIPYYERFLRRFPTVKSLSKAPLTAVLDHWSGLGYYSRAKNLHAAAQEVVRKHAGKIPAEVDELLDLPGIGRYTAGAIASIAYDRPAPVLDGNVIRVLSRHLGIQEDPRKSSIQRKLWETADRLVPTECPGDFNQALMELGATVCLPRAPRCSACPIRRGCQADEHGLQEQIPPPRENTPRKKIRYACGILEREGSVLIGRRPLQGLLPGLWEFPGGEIGARESPKQGLVQLLSKRLGIEAHVSSRPVRVRQILSHRELEIFALHCNWEGRPIRRDWYVTLRWIPRTKIRSAPMAAGMASLAARLWPQ